MESICLSVFLPHGQVEAERLQENILSLVILFVESSRTVKYGHVKLMGNVNPHLGNCLWTFGECENWICVLRGFWESNSRHIMTWLQCTPDYQFCLVECFL
jgi:hypothetical protein